jgi:hypothetical protein
MSWFKKDTPKFRFKSFIGDFSVATPVTTASSIRTPWMKKQDKDHKFQKCPGMLDYANAGYIITAHADIHIKANKVACNVIVESAHLPPHEGEMLIPRPFDFKIVEGLAPIQDGVVKWAGKIPLPWSVQADKGWSGYTMPALVHSNFLDKIFVYPGVVDYDNFHTLNFVFSPIKECEFTIPAGTPLLQIIPFKREKVFAAECGKATEKEKDKHLFNTASRLSHYYRKFLSSKKQYTMECPYKHREVGGADNLG